MADIDIVFARFWWRFEKKIVVGMNQSIFYKMPWTICIRLVTCLCFVDVFLVEFSLLF